MDRTPRGDRLSVGCSCSGQGRVTSPSSTPAALWADDVSILGKVKCLLRGALGSGQHSAEPRPALSLCPHHSTAQLWPFLPCNARMEHHKPTKPTNSSDEGNNQKRKTGGKTNLTLWHLWQADKNTKWQEVLFLKAIMLLLSEHTCVSRNPQQPFHGRELPPLYALKTKSHLKLLQHASVLRSFSGKLKSVGKKKNHPLFTIYFIS